MSDLLSNEDAFKMAINLIENSLSSNNDVALFFWLITNYPKITTMFIERIQGNGAESQDNAGYSLLAYFIYFAGDIKLGEDFVLQILEILLKNNDEYVDGLLEAEQSLLIIDHDLVNRIADDGQTPLGIALENHFYRIAILLLANGAWRLSVGDEHDQEAIDDFNTDFDGLDQDMFENFNIGMSNCLWYIGLDESLEMENYDKIIRTCFVMLLLGELGFHDYGVAEDLLEYM